MHCMVACNEDKSEIHGKNFLLNCCGGAEGMAFKAEAEGGVRKESLATSTTADFRTADFR
jgi:hypothetical protein